MTPRERRPHEGSAAEAAGPAIRIPPGGDRGEQALRDQIRDIRAILRGTRWEHRRHFTWCGCPIGDHGGGCPRAELHAALLTDPLPAPRLGPDRENELVRRVHAEPEYADLLAGWFRSRLAAGGDAE